MGIFLTLLIMVPLLGSVMEVINEKYLKTVTGFFSLLMSLFTLVLAVFFVLKFAPSSASPQLLDFGLWIPDWGISYKLGLDGLNTLVLILVSMIFFVFTILTFRDIKLPLFYIMLMLLEASVIGFILSYDIILKIIFWELSWIPIFFILLKMEKQSVSLFFSKYWFVSELLLIIACILLYNNVTGTYDLEKIIKTDTTINSSNKIIFILFVVSIFMRAAIFPFDSWLIKSVKNTLTTSSLITGVIVTLMPFLFFIQVVSTVFSKQLMEYFDILSIIILVSITVNVLRLYLSRNITTLITSQILIFNSLLMLFLLKPEEIILQASAEILVIKAMINILIICFGKKLITLSRKFGVSGLISTSPFITWTFVIAVVLSFGVPGLMMAKPVLIVISKWYKASAYLSLISLILLVSGFLLSSLNIAKFFKKTNKIGLSELSYRYIIIISIVIIVTGYITIKPNIIHRYASNYYTNILADRGY